MSVKISGRVNINTIDGVYEWSQAEYEKVFNSIPDWEPPSDWPTIPDFIDENEEVFYGLYAVYDEVTEGIVNLVAFQFGGDYTVDWGDGSSTEDVSSGIVAEHEFYFDSGGTLTSEGFKVVTIKVIPQPAQNITNVYFDRKHSTLVGASDPICSWLRMRMNLPNATLISIYPLLIRNTVRSVEIYKNNITTTSYYSFQNLYDVENIYADTTGWRSFYRMCRYCFALTNLNLTDTSSVTTFDSAFASCQSLRSFQQFDTSSVGNMSTAFGGCYALEQMPLLDTSEVTVFNSMFITCHKLRAIPPLNTSKVTSFSNFVSGCRKITTFPQIDTSAALSFLNTFNGCLSLLTIPLLDTSKGTNFCGMFHSTYQLKSIPLLDTSKGTNFGGMFESSAIPEIPHIDTSSGSIFIEMFRQTANLQTIPELVMHSATTVRQMFYAAYNLREIPELDTQNCVDFYYFFASCGKLKSVGGLNTTNGTNFGFMFSGCGGIRTLPSMNFGSASSVMTNTFACGALENTKVYGTPITHSYLNCSLSSESLDEIYTNLPNVTGQTITVTGNYGTTSDDPSIATAKGWTVTG